MPTDARALPAANTPLSKVELVGLLAMLSATVAFSIDAMLPALPEIGQTLNPANPKRAQLVIASFVVGLGIGTLFTGPLSDAFGRRTIATTGAIVYVVAALAAAASTSLEAVLVARLVQGLGAAGPRVVALAIIRDLFSGRQMARITSFVMMVFTLVPVLAPTLGAAISWAFGWRAIFVAFAVFSAISIFWLLWRQPETLPEMRRRPFRPKQLVEGMREVLSHRQVVLSILIQTLIFAMLFSALMSSQAVFGDVFGKTDSFPYWFGLMAMISASSSVLNALIVVRYGMRAVVLWALTAQAALTLLFLVAQLTVWRDQDPLFPLAFLWMTSIFYLAGLGIGNMNAIALEPMGHIAGMAASTMSATATVASILIAAPLGQSFDGTMVPLTIGVLVIAVSAAFLTSMLADSDGSIA